MDKQRAQIFIVDDDRSFGRSLKRLLTYNGYTAYYFESAASFLNAVPSGQKGIAVIDIHLPENDGFSLMTMMHDRRYTMPAIVITGQAHADSRDFALQKGAKGFLQKPFNERSILDLIESQERIESAE